MIRGKKKSEIDNESIKKTYLANMSHEIRTPMNAIVGLSDILLRESKDPDEREHLRSMQSATQNLLMTINNILDYENMLDGKIQLNPDAYDTKKFFEEVIDITKMNVSKKQVMFLTNINPNIPSKLYGDVVRIKQVITHLLSNAEKFTKSGYIRLNVDYVKENDDAVLTFAVKDTGIGIKKEVLDEVKKAFMQEDDSTRRNAGGLGIGLTIADSLLKLMGSELKIDSVENQGTHVAFSIKNKIVDANPAGVINNASKLNIAIFLQDREEATQVHQVLNNLSVPNKQLSNVGELFVEHGRNPFTHMIVTHGKYLQMKDIQEMTSLGIKFLVGVDYSTQIANDVRAVFYRKPLWFGEVADTFNGDKNKINKETDTISCVGTRILVVDDNDINLRVTAGLLKPYGITVDTATNADDGIRLVTKTKYDLIFMDYMMPERDGVEATEIIRSHNEPYFKALPIIALSANAIEGAEEMFIKAGMNDFITKPVQLLELEEILKKWLPKEMVKTVKREQAEVEDISPIFKDFKVIDVNLGLSYTNGDAEMYRTIVKDFKNTINKRKELLNTLAKEEDVSRFTIEVHSLKSSAKTIGALHLSEVSLELERLGHQRDIDAINNNLDRLNDEIDKVITDLIPLDKKDSDKKNEKKPFDKDKVKELLRQLFYLADDFDYETSKKTITNIGKFELSPRLEILRAEMEELNENVDYKGVSKKAVEMVALLNL